MRIETLPGGRVFAAVADGMGGHQGGAYASRRSLEVIMEGLQAGDSLVEAVSAANAQLNRDARHPDLSGMGTTAVGVVLDAGHFTVFNVGDSRCYRVSRTGIEQLSLDHSFVADALRSGSMDKGAAEATPWKNALTRSLGGDDSVEVDEFGPFATTDPQVLLLCSDGVYKSVPDDLIERVVLGTPDVNVAAKALVDVAYRRGSDDNLSAVMIEFGYLQRTASPLELPPSIDAPPPVASHQGPSNGGTAPLGWPEPRPAEPRGDAIPTVAIRRVPPPRVRQRSLVSTSLFAGSALLLGLAVFGILRSRLADAGATPRLVEGSGAEVTVADTGSTGGPSSPSQDSPLSAGKTGLDSAPGQLRRGREEVSAAQSSPANAKGVTKERLLADPPTLTTADKAGEGSKGLPGGGARPSTTRDSTAPAAEPTKAPARERDPGEDQAPRVGTVVVRESTEAAQRPAAGTRSEAREGDTSSVGGAPRAEVPSADKQAKPDRERFKKEAKVLPKLSERARDSALTAIEARCLAANKAERSGLRNARAVRWIPGVAKDVYDCAIR